MMRIPIQGLLNVNGILIVLSTHTLIPIYKPSLREITTKSDEKEQQETNAKNGFSYLQCTGFLLL